MASIRISHAGRSIVLSFKQSIVVVVKPRDAVEPEEPEKETAVGQSAAPFPVQWTVGFLIGERGINPPSVAVSPSRKEENRDQELQ